MAGDRDAETAGERDAEILTERDGPVTVVRLNRPDRLNAVSLPLYRQLLDALDEAEADPDVRCVVLTGTGRAFCSGADLKAHAAGAPDASRRGPYIEAAQNANHRLQTMEIPVVAAVNGAAVGAGLELALSADLLIVAIDARLRLPEIALGTFVGGGVAYTLAERVGVLKAREILYFGDFFTGEHAAEIGIANLAVPAEEVLSTARSWAGRLATRAPISLSEAKRLIGPAGTLSRDEVLQREREVLERIFGTEDWAEGVRAMREGREPRFRGR